MLRCDEIIVSKSWVKKILVIGAIACTSLHSFSGTCFAENRDRLPQSIRGYVVSYDVIGARGSRSNSAGIVAGTIIGEQLDQAALFSENASIVLDFPPFAESSYAHDVNDSNNAVGQISWSAVQFSTAFAWIDGKPVELPRLDSGNYASANAINNNNQIVGVGGSYAMMWTAPSDASTSKDFRAEIIGSGTANDINDTGHAVGYSANDPYSFTHFGSLGSLGGTFGSAIAVNDHDVIVGTSENAQGDWRAFRFEDGGCRILAC